jgi:FtsH-binding integral membrane protein
MFDQTNNNRYFTASPGTYDVTAGRIFMRQVFSWMTLAMVITAITAYLFASDPSLVMTLINPETGSMMSFGFARLSPAVLTLLFVTFSVLMGMSLSFILLIYTMASVFKTFLVTSLMFGVMAITGYTTKTDLTRFGSIMMMGLIGLVIAMLVNMFLQSGTMDYIISIIGVLIFTGLTAYDVQRLKNMSAQIGTSGEANARKLSIMGALTLYLDFINLFIFLLRFLGDRK